MKRKYKLNEDFFRSLTPDSAYVLGYVWTDGCLKRFGRGAWGLLLECSAKDREILDRIKEVMESESPIIVKTKTLPSGKKTELVKLSIYSKRIAEDLMKYGIIEGKSKKDPILVGVGDNMIFHFIRGVLDGDGSVGLSSRNTDLKRITFTGKKNLLSLIDDKFVEKLGTKRRIVYRSFPTLLTRSECWVTVYSRQDDIKKIASALYKDANISLFRKKEKLMAAKAA